LDEQIGVGVAILALSLYLARQDQSIYYFIGTANASCRKIKPVERIKQSIF
jgi:hypothetical protein